MVLSQGTWVLGTCFDFEQVFDISWLLFLQIDRNACRGLCCVLHLQGYGPKLAEKLSSTVGAKCGCILDSPKPIGTELQLQLPEMSPRHSIHVSLLNYFNFSKKLCLCIFVSVVCVCVRTHTCACSVSICMCVHGAHEYICV